MAANRLHVSRVLRAAGFRPRHGQRMNGPGGYRSAQDGVRVRVSHWFGPEADYMPDDERDALRAEFLEDYRLALLREGYLVELSHGALYVTV